MALLPLESAIVLTAEQRACLADLAIAPLRLVEVWDVRREARTFHYAHDKSRVGHAGGTILDLGALGFCETGPEHDDFVITAAGRKRLELR